MKQSSSDTRGQMATLLEQEIEHATALNTALQLEKDILGNKDFEALEVVTVKKQAVIDALNALDAERSRLLHECGFTADNAGTETYIHAQAGPQGQQLERLWRRLLDIISSCRQQNLVNGSIIGMSMRHCAQALAVLRGQDPTDALYDSRGNAASANQRQRYVKA
jgi:flagella synthesis protein FlgN